VGRKRISWGFGGRVRGGVDGAGGANMIATVSTDHHPMIMPMIMRRRIQECLAKGSGFRV